jgi:DNA-directed RNA polymerase subunit RPC12/RpoP
MGDNPEICRSCGKDLTENFCPNCGEKRFHRIRGKDLFADFLSDGANLETPILRTIKGLFTQPGILVKEYISGDRKKYYRPFQFYFLLLAVYILFFYFLDGFQAYYNLAGADEAADYVSKQDRAFIEIKKAQVFLFRYLVVLSIPISTVLTFLFFRRGGLSFAEHLVLNLYVLSQGLIIGIVECLLSPISAALSLSFVAVTSISYYAWAYRGLFEQSWGRSLLKAFGVFFIGLIVLALLIAVISVVYVVLLN